LTINAIMRHGCNVNGGRGTVPPPHRLNAYRPHQLPRNSGEQGGRGGVRALGERVAPAWALQETSRVATGFM